MKSVLVFFILLLSLGAKSQQDPYFVSEGFSPFWNNPASSGSWNKFSVNVVGGIQLNGFDQPPQKLMANVEFAIPMGEMLTSSSLFEIGGGMNFIATSFWGVRQQIFQIPLNYQVRLKNTNLSLGVSPGFRRLDFSDVYWVPPTSDSDPLIPDGKQSAFQLDAGLFWYGERFYAGLSSTQMTAPRYDELIFQSARHYNLQGGYRFKVGKHYIFPQVNMIFDGASLGIWNLNYFQFKEDIFSVGIGLSGGLDLLLAATARYKQFKIAYNYDLVKTPLGGSTSGSHQIRLSFIMDKAGKN